MELPNLVPQIVDVCEEWQKEQKLARLLEEIGCDVFGTISFALSFETVRF